MDEVMGIETRELSTRGFAGVLAVLLCIVSILDQTFWVRMDGLLDGLLVPIMEIREEAFGKVQARISYIGNEEIGCEADLLLGSVVIPEEPSLLLKEAVPTLTASAPVSSGHPAVGEDAAIMQSVIPDIVQPQAEETDHLSVEATLPEVIMPTLERPSAAVPESLPDTAAIVEAFLSDLHEPAASVPEAVPEIPTLVETTAEDLEKTSATVSEQPDTPISAEVSAPAPVETDVIVPEKPAEELITPEPVMPDTEIPEPGAAEDVPTDVVGEESMETVPASCFLLDEAGMLYGFLPEYAEIIDGCLALPAECTGIRSGAFSGCGAGIVELYIPAGVSVIEGGAFTGLDNLEWIDVEGGNPGYTSNLGVLFDSSMSVLVKFPSGRVSFYSIPSNVTAVADRAFEGTSLSKLDIRNCTDLSFSGNAFGYSTGNGIEVSVPEAQFDMYSQILSGYVVMLTK